VIALAAQSVTWIKVQKPTFDLVGVVLSSIGLAAICVGVALVLGLFLGFGFILHRRRVPPPSWADHGLQLLTSRRI